MIDRDNSASRMITVTCSFCATVISCNSVAVPEGVGICSECSAELIIRKCRWCGRKFQDESRDTNSDSWRSQLCRSCGARTSQPQGANQIPAARGRGH